METENQKQTSAPRGEGSDSSAVVSCEPSEFAREFRYLVLKFKDVNKYLTTAEKEMLMAIVKKVAKGRADDIKMPIECVVVESDWPEYEPTWQAIQERVTGKPIGCSSDPECCPNNEGRGCGCS